MEQHAYQFRQPYQTKIDKEAAEERGRSVMEAVEEMVGVVKVVAEGIAGQSRQRPVGDSGDGERAVVVVTVVRDGGQQSGCSQQWQQWGQY